MVTFDFATAAGSIITTGTGVTATNTADGVTFTLSGDVAGGREFLAFGNQAVTSIPILITDVGHDDQIILTWVSTANTANTRLSGNNPTNPVQLNWGSVVGIWDVHYLTAGGGSSTLGHINASNGSYSFQHNAVTGIVFTSLDVLGIARLVVTSLSGNNLNCFTAGTRIATQDGPRAVETLKAGDLVRTADGRLTPVKWLGTQDIDTRLMHPAKVNPICITAGALGNGLPERDLLLSQDHAVEIGGTLYNAGTLVNGQSIYQMKRMPREGFTYYHIETEAHELLLAEGVASESFIDYAGRDSFDNAAEAEAKVIPEMALPRVSTKRLVPEAARAS